ncbi:putative nucleoredoxin 3 [Cinnamomum micranthum f. kanehirae]|uniref:protein-disulfide reductase n=1 Tax=Cinnamomum micranthum f. kanehirae TaxID=337451 RepID=A0A443PL84_9MAGN|nr:putative nucleoredoxin 3 [Cinnamomum micranthum f. kanehirae]
MAASRVGLEMIGGGVKGDVHHLSVLESEGIEFLLSPKGKVPISSLDQRKTICLFFSAHWCRPCRVFTPQLLQLYNTLNHAGNKQLEIILISLDRDFNGFTEHFKSMPWLATPFNVNVTSRLCNHFSINHIPFLIPLGSDGERIIQEEDAVPLVEDYGIEAFPFGGERREHLKALDEAKRRWATLEDLIVTAERNYVISADGTKVPVSNLAGKTVGLYFGGLWCPPCRAFTHQLIEAYNELEATKNESFQIIFVSTDRDEEEFKRHISTMPWLAVPYNEKTRRDLCRIFDIKGIPALVLMGQEGKALSTNGRAIISTYGASAFPFTESKVNEVKAALEKEGEELPRQVVDPKHNHVLKLDMAKAYICDSCRRQGRFWVFSCNICDFDLHPGCVQHDEIINT